MPIMKENTAKYVSLPTIFFIRMYLIEFSFLLQLKMKILQLNSVEVLTYSTKTEDTEGNNYSSLSLDTNNTNLSFYY